MRTRLLVLAVVATLSACGGSQPTPDAPTASPVPDDRSQDPLLSVLKADTAGRGTVTSAPEGITCLDDCEADSARFAPGIAVELTATPMPGSYFVGWSGDCQGNTCDLVMDADRSVTATFLPDAPTGAWFAGDGHVHNDHSNDGSFLRQGLDDRGPGTTDIEDQIGFATTQQLDWMPLTDHRTFDQHYDPQWDSDAILLITGEEANGSPHCTVFGAIDTAVQGASPDDDPGFRTIQQSIWDVRAQGALWNQAHPDRRSYEQATDTVNAFASQVGQSLAEVWNRGENPEAEIDYAENRWNAGWRFGVIGASDNHDKVLWAASGPGSPTTYVFAPDASERGILSGLRAGRTVVSSGPTGPFPVLEADMDGDGIFEALGGDEVFADPGATFTLRVSAQRAAGLDVRLYAAPGRDDGPDNPLPPVATFSGTALASGPQTLDVTAPTTGHGWWYLMIRGPGLVSGLEAPNDPSDQLLAMTSPVFVSVTGEAAEPRPEIAVPPDAGAPDGALAVFAGETFRGFGDVAVNGGVAHLVAETHDATSTQIVYRRGLPGSAADVEGAVVISDSPNARFPRVAAQGGTVWVVWQDEGTDQTPRRPVIRLRSSTDGGMSWGDATTLSDGSGRAMHPDLAITPDGLPVVVWQDNATGPLPAPLNLGAFDVMAQVVGRDAAPINLSGADKTVLPANPTDTRSARHPASIRPAVAVRNDGLIAVSWQDNRFDSEPGWTGAIFTGEGTDPDDWEILVATRAADGDWSAPVNASSDPTHADWHSTAAFSDDGTLHIAWDAKDASGSSGRDLFVRATRSVDDGASFAPFTAVTDVAEPGMARRPVFGRDASDGLVITWADSHADDWRWRVRAAAVLADGYGPARLLTGPGSATFQRIDRGVLIFTSDRRLRRVQRDNRFAVLARTVPAP